MINVIPRSARQADDHLMNALRVTPLIVSALLMGAHFFRSGNLPLVVVILLAPLLLLLRSRWSVVALQIALVIAAVEWIRTAMTIARERAAAGTPATRMFVILGCAAAFTALAALPLRRFAGPPTDRGR
jgi:hypothetical protein